MITNPDIHILDLNFQGNPEVTAAYLVVGPEGPILIETGPGSTLTTLLSQIRKLGFEPEQIKHVLVTHIHLDHAGAAGWWAQQGAQVYVHSFGARHLISPEKLMASAQRIYGDKMDLLWGEMLPAPADRVTELFDNDILEIAGLKITALETPGHARHHHVYVIGDVAFTGDAAAVQLPGFGLPDIPAPPPEFDLEVWEATLDRLLAQKFRQIYPTHFGLVADVQGHLSAVKALVRETAVFIQTQMQAGLERDDILTAYEHWFAERARAAGLDEAAIAHYAAANPLYMSVDGIMRYWRRRAQD
ncbi:MAG: MBL fold metallo-hydrolase [Ardenticatenaceae bacterium]|nr:MBL fold metallo-hydrolase [Anaerolineales bacterium]MCB8942081.1 MBL fold metallo-hydrolase [Ardenticatenaceae bacterium]MCB8973159.1 MBL fold metallo-hydrolase [Ardenticatenaceae bacterium]